MNTAEVENSETSRMKLTLVSVKELYSRFSTPLDLSKRDRPSYSTLWRRKPFVVRPPLVQAGNIDCPGIPNYENSEISAIFLPNAIVTQTGAVIYNDEFLIEETVEGGFAENCLLENADGVFLTGPIDYIDEDIININRYGTFNHSIFLSEILPQALVCSFLPGADKLRAGIHFADFMSAHSVNLRMQLLSTMGFNSERIFRRTHRSSRYRGVLIIKINDRYKNHRVSQLMPLVSGMLKANFADNRPSPKRVYISRQQSTCRRVTNFDSVSQNILSRYGFTPVSLDTMSIQEQVNIFSKADVVLAEHGAGLVNSMFMRPGAILIEVFPRPLIGHWMFRLIAMKLGLNYFFAGIDVPEGWQTTQDDWEVDERLYEQLLERVG